MLNPLDLTGKHIILTGASQGIGKATAIYISRLGAKVSLIARNEEKLRETLNMLDGEGHSIFPFDLKNIDLIEELVNHIVHKIGKINGLVHSAGIASMRPLPLTKYDYIHDMMLVNFYSFVELVRCFSKKKNSYDGSSFVGISSVAGTSGNKSKIAYGATKAAMDSAIKSMAKELELRKIRVNSVLPGWVATDIYSDFIDQQGDSINAQVLLARQYMGLIDPDTIAGAISYLLSEASKFTTGTSLIVDGGYLS